MKPLLPAALLLTLATTGLATAGPVTDFESAFRQAWASYREALFRTNSGDATAAADALSRFDEQWAALMETWRDAPPPQYEDDPRWPETVSGIENLAAEAEARVADNALPAAHETLEGIRDLAADLHDRNRVETFSDRMNAYHAQMERILSMDLANPTAETLTTLHERAAALAWLSDDVLRRPPPEAADDPAYQPLADAFAGSVTALLAAARSREPERIRAAAGKLKPAYAKLFLDFG